LTRKKEKSSSHNAPPTCDISHQEVTFEPRIRSTQHIDDKVDEVEKELDNTEPTDLPDYI
jgi:hypothetical protein